MVSPKSPEPSCLSAAHCKSSMFGCSLNIPITDGRFNLGTWQVGAALTLTTPARHWSDPGFLSYRVSGCVSTGTMLAAGG